MCKSLADVQLMKHLSGLVKNHSHFMKITPSGSESIELDMINDLTLAPSSAQKNSLLAQYNFLLINMLHIVKISPKA